MSHDVFISYSSKDKAIADAVCAKLEDEKIPCWIAPRDVSAGANFAESIIEAIDTCKVFVLIWSASTNASEHILNEINRAFDQGITIIPFRIQDIQPTRAMSYYFGRAHWLDAMNPPLEKHINKLADTIFAILGKKKDEKQLMPIKHKEVEEKLELEPSIRKPQKIKTQEEKKEPEISKKKLPVGFLIGGLLIIVAIVGFLLFKDHSRNSSSFAPPPTLSVTQFLGTYAAGKDIISTPQQSEVNPSSSSATLGEPEYVWPFCNCEKTIPYNKSVVLRWSWGATRPELINEFIQAIDHIALKIDDSLSVLSSCYGEVFLDSNDNLYKTRCDFPIDLSSGMHNLELSIYLNRQISDGLDLNNDGKEDQYGPGFALSGWVKITIP